MLDSLEADSRSKSDVRMRNSSYEQNETFGDAVKALDGRVNIITEMPSY